MNTKGNNARAHIGIFGRRNTGKSSLVNLLAGQEVAIVSDVAGTTTDPVSKTMEIGGLGPVVVVDTAGIDDEGALGEKRISRTQRVLHTIDFAILLFTDNDFGTFEQSLVQEFRQRSIPFTIIYNKEDLRALDKELARSLQSNLGVELISLSAIASIFPENLIRIIQENLPKSVWNPGTLVGDLIRYGDTVLLITPIDIEAPDGRLILPQVQVIRDVLDHDGVVAICKEREVDAFFGRMQPKPALVVTDSQVFLKADASIPREIPLTSFSIVLARQKGDFQQYIQGTPHISRLKDGDKVLLLESCSHHVSCDDIGRVKIPRWMGQFTGKDLKYTVVAGNDEIPGHIGDYSLVVQCGGCMITTRQLGNRLRAAIEAGVPVTNYGMAIAWVQGIFNRAVEPFLAKGILSGSDNYL